MLKILGISLIGASFTLLAPMESHAGWKDELKKASKSANQIGHAVRNPTGPDAQKLLGKDPKKEASKLCDSVGHSIDHAGSFFHKLAHTLHPHPDDCAEPSNSTPNASN